MNKIRKIAVLTSGGDAPGMNAAIRAVVRVGIFYNIEIVGVRRGYTGLLEKDFVVMQNHSVSQIISQGGTILKSSRCLQFCELKRCPPIVCRCSIEFTGQTALKSIDRIE